jgi:outer membrane protein OmpA-like peptidoglycan-associated protein
VKQRSAVLSTNLGEKFMAMLHIQCTFSWVTGLYILVAVGNAQAQVKFMERVPSPDEIRAVLAPSATHPSGRRARGIEWVREPLAITAAGNDGAAQNGQLATAPAVAFPVVFSPGTARVTLVSMPYVQAMVKTLERNPEMRVCIEGHTDAAGNPRANMVLSWERSFAVYRLMVERFGIDPQRLQPVGKGATEPLEATDARSSANRRVQFRVMG